MRYVIYGAGAIGGTLGARLFRSGADVLLIARGPHLEAIRSDGLRFVSATIDERLPIPAVGQPSEASLGGDDAVVLCMKGQHTEEAVLALAAVAPSTIPVVCCQNGVANERMALRRFSNVYGMVAWLPANHLTPGEVVSFADGPGGWLDAGRYPGGVDGTIEEITAGLTNAGFSSQPDPAIMRQKYTKLLSNLGNAVGAVIEEGATEIGNLIRDEALACYAAAGIGAASQEEAQERRKGAVRDAPVPGFERSGGSSRQSIMRGTGNIEADYLNGEIVLLGRLHGVPTPANSVLQQLANRVAREGLPVGSFSAAEVESLIAEAS